MTRKPDSNAAAEAAIDAFLANIGPRELTADEARQLHMLRLQYGLDRVGGVIEKLTDAD